MFSPQNVAGAPESPDAFYRLMRDAVCAHMPCTKLVIYFTPTADCIAIEMYSNALFASVPDGVRAARRDGTVWTTIGGHTVTGARHEGASLYTQHSFGAFTPVATYMANALTLVFGPMRPEKAFSVTFSWNSKVHGFTVLPWEGVRVADVLKVCTGSFFGDMVCLSTGPYEFTWRSRLELGLPYVGRSCIVTDFDYATTLAGPCDVPKASAKTMLQFTPPRPKAAVPDADAAAAAAELTRADTAQLSSALALWNTWSPSPGVVEV
jgi:hypothetical protein